MLACKRNVVLTDVIDDLHGLFLCTCSESACSCSDILGLCVKQQRCSPAADEVMLLQVQAEGLETSAQELQSSLAEAHQELSLKRQTVDGLTHKFDRQVCCLVDNIANAAQPFWHLF